MQVGPIELLINNPDTEEAQVFTDDANAPYYLLYLFIPYDLLSLCSKDMQNIPRRFWDLVHSEKGLTILHSDWFASSLINCYAFMAWQILRIEYKLHPVYQVYSVNNPLLHICTMLDIWKDAMVEAGLLPTDERFRSDTFYLFYQFGYQTFEHAIEVLTPIFLSAIKKHGFDKIIETVKKYPCLEDFSKWHSNPRRNFERKWYHQRSRFHTESLEKLQQDYAQKNDGSEWDLPDEKQDYENEVLTNYSFDRFMKSLDEKDRRMIHLRMSGNTYAEIAKELGYKDHTAVLKRIRKLRPVFRKFMDF